MINLKFIPTRYAPKDQCDDYSECGPYGICDTNASPVCNCTLGFQPKNLQAWSLRDGRDGCVRQTSLDCSDDGFLALKGMKLPDSTNAYVDRTMSLKECRRACEKNCSCTAFSSADISDGGTGCVMWTGQLVDMRHYVDGGQDMYVRLAASDIGKSIQFPHLNSNPPSRAFLFWSMNSTLGNKSFY